MNDYTVNGKPWAECLKEIRKYKKKTKTKVVGEGKAFGYFHIDEYFQRLDDVIGTDHYEVENTDFQRITLSSGQEIFVVKCKITIIDDEGRRIIAKSAYGGAEILYAKASGRTDIGNAPGNACKDAFKAAAELIGILGYHGYRAPAGGTQGAEDVPAKNPAKPLKEGERPAETPLHLVSEGAFFEAGKKEGRKVWKLAAHEKVSEKQVKKDLCEIIFYPNHYVKNAEKFNAFYRRVGEKPTPFKAIVSPCGVREGRAQYIFKGFSA